MEYIQKAARTRETTINAEPRTGEASVVIQAPELGRGYGEHENTLRFIFPTMEEAEAFVETANKTLIPIVDTEGAPLGYKVWIADRR